MSAAPTVAPAVLPAPLAIVPADQVEAAIAAAHGELESLEAELARLLADADTLEALVGDDPFDPDSHEFVAVRFQRFLEGLRAEANSELDALMATAEDRRLRHGVLSWDAVFAERATTSGRVGWTEAVPAAPVVQVVPAAPVLPAAPVQAPPVVPVAPVVAVAPPQAHPAAPVAPAMPGPEGAADPPPAPQPLAAPVPMAVPRVPVAAPPAPDATPLVDTALVDLAPPTGEHALEAEFWSDEPSSAWTQARRTFRTVGWQAAAVLLLVAAVLVRVG